MRGVARCRFGDITTFAVYDDSAVSGIPVFRCKSPPWPVPDWVNVEIAMDGQVFTEAKNVKFQYYGEYDILAATPVVVVDVIRSRRQQLIQDHRVHHLQKVLSIGATLLQ